MTFAQHCIWGIGSAENDPYKGHVPKGVWAKMRISWLDTRKKWPQNHRSHWATNLGVPWWSACKQWNRFCINRLTATHPGDVESFAPVPTQHAYTASTLTNCSRLMQQIWRPPTTPRRVQPIWNTPSTIFASCVLFWSPASQRPRTSICILTIERRRDPGRDVCLLNVHGQMEQRPISCLAASLSAI